MSEAEKDDTQADATFDGNPAKKGGASASIAWLALFLSLLSVAGIGYLLLEKMRTDNSADASSEAIAAMEREIDASGQSIDKLQRDINELSADDTRTTSAIDSLRRNIDQSADLLDSLPVRMSNLERSVAALQGVSIEARNTYLIAEAEYYMQIANAQLQLAGNPYLAALALEQAKSWRSRISPASRWCWQAWRVSWIPCPCAVPAALRLLKQQRRRRN